MPETTRARPAKSLRFPSFTSTASDGRRDEESAAWFYEQAYNLNPTTNITLHADFIAQEWRRRARGLYTESGKKGKAMAMASELLSPRLRRLMADLHMTYAMFKFLNNARAIPIHQALSVQRSKDREIRMLYGFPGHILKLPFYLDFTPSNIKYEWLLAAIRENNPGFVLNKARGDQLMAHVYEKEFRGTSDKLAEYHSRMLRMKYEKGEMYWDENPPIASAATAVISTYIMLLPNQCSNYASFAQACVTLNSTCQPSKEMIAEAFRLTFPLLIDLEGESLETALQKAMPPSLAHYHQGVSRSRNLLNQNRAAEYAKEPLKRCTNGKPILPMKHNLHSLILVDAKNRIIPLARLPLKDYPGANWARLYNPHPSVAKLNFWHIFQALNPWVESASPELQDTIWEEAWAVAVISKWDTQLGMKKVMAPDNGVDNIPGSAWEAAVGKASNSIPEHTADDATDDAVQSGIALRFGIELPSTQAGVIGARRDGAGPVKQAAVLGDKEEEMTESPSIMEKDSFAMSRMSQRKVLEVETGKDEGVEKGSDTEHSTKPTGSSTEVAIESDPKGEACDTRHSKESEDGTSEYRLDRVERSYSQGQKTLTTGSPIDRMAESDGVLDRAYGDGHSNESKDKVSEIGSKEDEEGKKSINGRPGAKAKDYATEVGYKDHQKADRACNAGESRKRKGRSSEYDTGDDDKRADVSDGELPVTKRRANQGKDGGVPCEASLIPGHPSAFPGDFRGGL